jgi:NAD/NADP transhydrogenase beta subunit
MLVAMKLLKKYEKESSRSLELKLNSLKSALEILWLLLIMKFVRIYHVSIAQNLYTCIKKSVIETITDEDDDNDGAVQFYSQDITQLLDIADKWVTIRGFCLAFGWLQDMRKFQSMALQTDLYRKVNPPTQASKRMMRETQTITANHLVFLLFYVISLVVVYHLYRILLLTVLCTLPPYAHYYSFCCLYRCLLPSRYIRLRH